MHKRKRVTRVRTEERKKEGKEGWEEVKAVSITKQVLAANYWRPRRRALLCWNGERIVNTGEVYNTSSFTSLILPSILHIHCGKVC